MASSRHRTNNISQLQDDGDNWIKDHDGLCNLAFDYFSNLFTINNNFDNLDLSFIQNRSTNSDNSLMLAPFTMGEFKRAISQMHSNKAPGPDGLNPTFF